ncbi:hypothetical protein [Deinococcus yavapaiensis]|uniref:hypothetical protein n=1 Tax=Deinococcus yavapaiensis TaxID=309889 RepID=UPI000DA1104E|nr:hypothetical protein [Deinococcus yavapaiensis]
MYERVWTTPAAQLVAEFGVSDVTIAKWCRSRNIPKPPRGYWQQLAAGKKLKRPPLRASVPGAVPCNQQDFNVDRMIPGTRLGR